MLEKEELIRSMVSFSLLFSAGLVPEDRAEQLGVTKPQENVQG